MRNSPLAAAPLKNCSKKEIMRLDKYYQPPQHHHPCPTKYIRSTCRKNKETLREEIIVGNIPD